MATGLIDHLLITNQINKWQRAYLPQKEANEQVHRLIQEANTALPNGWSSAAVFPDVEKAFDLVWHDGLCFKLCKLNLPAKVIRQLYSFLNNRRIAVKAGKEMSESVLLKAGTPQRSVLSPIPFNLYVNDIPFNDQPKVQISQYADDLAIWTSHRYSKGHANTWNIIYKDIQAALKLLESWCNKWRIKLNPTKTELKAFSNSTVPPSPLILFNTPIPVSKNYRKFLGEIFHRQSSTCSLIARQNEQKPKGE